MDISKIKAHQAVYVDGPGGLAGASEVHIGNVEKVEGGKFVKMINITTPDHQTHWFPIDWIRTVDEQAVFLNKKLDEALSGLMNEAPN